MLLHADGGDAYSTTQLPALFLWTTSTGVVVVANAGRTGATGDNAFYFDTALASALTVTVSPTLVSGVATAVWGHAVRLLSVASHVTLGGIDTPLSRFDLVCDSTGKLSVTQTSGGTLLGTICETVTGAVPIGDGGCYIGLKIIFTADLDSAVQLEINGEVLVQGALLALGPTDTPYTTLRHGGGLADGAATWYVDDVYLLDGVPADTGVQGPDGLLYNNDFLGDVHVEALYPTAAGRTQTTDNTPWTPSAGANWQNVDDHPPDEDVTYNSAEAAGQRDTYQYILIRPLPCGTISRPLYGLIWLGRLRAEAAESEATVLPVVRRIVGGTFATDVVETGDAQLISADSYQYYPHAFDRNPTLSDAPWTWAVFLASGANAVPTEFGVQVTP